MRKRILDKGWRDFVTWCQRRRVKYLPAHPWTVAAYLRWCETNYRNPDIVTITKAIARGHLLNCSVFDDDHPTVRNTMAMIETRADTQAQRADLFRDMDFVEDRAAPSEIPKKHPPAHKKKAISKNKRRTRIMNVTPRLVSRRPSG